ncbi:MAG: Hint domain-containing protein [Sphingomonadales bacterium]|nr:Hint domain-containing protein [Sphingomonadales bacterium]
MNGLRARLSDLLRVETLEATAPAWRASDALLDLGHGLYGETVLVTAEGPRAVARISAGDRLMTFDHGFQVVSHVERLAFSRIPVDIPESMWPLRIPVGLFGNAQDRFIAPDQNILIESDLAEMEFGDPFVLIPARVLAALPQVERVKPSPERVIHRLRFERPELVVTEGGAVLLCDTGSIFDHWEAPDQDRDDGTPLGYSSLPYHEAADLMRREIAHDGGVAAHLAKNLSRMQAYRRAG